MFLIISASAYMSQRRMAFQLEFTTTTMTSLLDKSNNALNLIQNANRTMMQHAMSEGDDQRQRLQQQFMSSVDALKQAMTALHQALGAYPTQQQQLDQVQTPINQFIRQAEAHLAIQNERILTSRQAVAELAQFNDSFFFFKDDLNVVIEDATDNDLRNAAWDTAYILQQGQAARGYLEKTLAISDPKTLQQYSEQLNNSLARINGKATDVEKNAPLLYPDLKPYIEQLNFAITNPSGLFLQHSRYLTLNAESNVLLGKIANTMDTITRQLGATTDSIRQLAIDTLHDAEQTLRTNVTLNISLAVISIVLALFIGMTVIRSIRKPLSAIMSSLASLSTGDLTQPIRHTYHSELGQVTRNVNQLHEKLHELIAKIQQSAITINEVAVNNFAMSERTNADVANQRAQTDSVATAVTEMEAAVHEVAAHAADTSQEVAKVTEDAHLNMENMSNNLHFVNQLKNSLDEAASVIRELSGESQKIGEILSVIQSIAEQTNLLALNAAIEAARAGEQGRGFAVVADEVRLLANRTQASANEINDMIESLQSQADKAVAIVSGNVEQADRSLMQTEQSHQSLTAMVARLQTINDMSSSIATASEEQSAVAKEVAQTVVQISDMAGNIADNAGKAAGDSEKLQQLSTTQSQLVSQFKLR